MTRATTSSRTPVPSRSRCMPGQGWQGVRIAPTAYDPATSGGTLRSGRVGEPAGGSLFDAHVSRPPAFRQSRMRARLNARARRRCLHPGHLQPPRRCRVRRDRTVRLPPPDGRGSESARARMGRLEDDELLEDQHAASRRLATVSDPNRQRVIGFCMGGRQSFLWATEVATLRCTVMFCGASIMRNWVSSTTPLDRANGIRCSVLGLFGKDDTNPSTDDVRKFRPSSRDWAMGARPASGHGRHRATGLSRIRVRGEDVFAKALPGRGLLP